MGISSEGTCDLRRWLGPILHGWSQKDNKFKVIQSKASVVQTMFQMYLDGHGTGAIARCLNSKNIPTFTRKKWQQTTIKYYLRFRGVSWRIPARATAGWKGSEDGHHCGQAITHPL